MIISPIDLVERMNKVVSKEFIEYCQTKHAETFKKMYDGMKEVFIGIKKEKWYGAAKQRKPFDFLGKKWIFMGISVALIAGGFIMMGVNKANTGDALNLGLDFKAQILIKKFK